jgi:hypothetical protein
MLRLASSPGFWHHTDMPKQLKQKPKRITDENQIAFELVRRSTGEPLPESQQPTEPRSQISEYFATIGARGGKIGGKRRLKTMTKEQRQKIARKAAKTRWSKTKNK